MENFRRFEATDPYGRLWRVEFRWQQNAITIRHSDAVNVKFQVQQGDDVAEKVVAIDPASDCVEQEDGSTDHGRMGFQARSAPYEGHDRDGPRYGEDAGYGDSRGPGKVFHAFAVF